jgi:phage terminase Nu1 subunit (DNA packaging protein)
MSSRAKTGAIVVPLGIAALVIVIVLVFGGGGGVSTATQLAAAKQSYCTHLRELTQEQRGPAVNRAAKKIKRDAAAFRAAGDPATARQLKAVVRAAKRVVAALAANKDPSAAAAAMQKAVKKAPSC